MKKRTQSNIVIKEDFSKTRAEAEGKIKGESPWILCSKRKT